MARTSKFVRGADTLPFGAGTGYSLGLDFRPPIPVIGRVFAGGTSLNRLGGSSLVSSKANNRHMYVPVVLNASNEAKAIKLARRLVSFLSAESTDPLYFEIKYNALVEPSWGQFGVPLRYKVVSADVSVSDLFETLGIANEPLFMLPVVLTVRPYGFGKQQQLLNGIGGLFEDFIGVDTRMPRGVMVGRTGTNKMTNPAFTHGTWNNGWTEGAAMDSEQNVDALFILFGFSSAHIWKTGATNNHYYQTINVGNTNTHTLSFFAQKPDGSAVTASDCQVFYNTAKASTYQAIGNGWYRVSASFAGIASNQFAGAFVLSDVYVDGFQLEELAYATPFYYGDLLGCAWSGTAHASTSTRTAASIKTAVGNLINLPQGAISITWRTDVDNTGPDQTLFDTRDGGDTTSLRGYFLAADDKFYLTDGTNTISTAAQTFAVGDIINLIFEWGPSGLAIYKNGSSSAAASGGTYTIPSTGANLLIGSTYTPDGQVVGTLMGATIYDKTHSATQAATIGMATLAAAEEGIVDYIPWLWTKDGDGIVDNCEDSTRDNWAVAAGIPGDVEAETIIDGQLSTGLSVLGSVYISNVGHDVFIKPSELYQEWSGVVDANSSGGQFFETVTVINTEYDLVFSLNKNQIKALSGRKFYGFTRFYDGGLGVVSVRPYFLQGLLIHYGPAVSLTTGAGFYLPRFNPINVPEYSSLFLDEAHLLSSNFQLGAAIKQTVAGGLWRIDYYTCLYSPLIRIKGDAQSTNGFVLNGSIVNDYTVATRVLTGSNLSTSGDEIALEPGKYNHLMSLMGDEATASAIASTLTYYAVRITPRWGLL